MGNTTKVVSSNGEKIFWSPEVCNTGFDDCKGVFATLLSNPLPNGIELVLRGVNGNDPTPTYEKGYFNWTDKIWQIGDINSGECFKINLEFVITDIEAVELDGTWTIQLQASSSCVEDTLDNTQNLVITRKEECETVNIKIGPTVDCTTSGVSLKIG